MLKSIRRQTLLLTVAATIWIADQATKAIVVRNLPVGMPWNPVGFLRPFVSITHVANSGAAFGMLPDRGTFFAIVAVVVSGAILYFGRLVPAHQWWLSLSLGLQLGGALGNLTDRLHYGYVIDFIEVRFSPVFNVADSAIVLGVCILAYHLWKEEEHQKAAATGGDNSHAVAGDHPVVQITSPTSQNDGP